MLISTLFRRSNRIALLSSLRNYAKAAYDGEGKTTVRILNQDIEAGLMIDCYATYGFRLNNGITVLGPMAIFPRNVLSWHVRSADEVTKESLTLFKVLDPKVDIVVIGLDTFDRKVVDRVFRATKELKLGCEILSVEHACSTFNFLNSEGRYVCGALIPPTTITPNEDDMLASKLHYQNLYGGDSLDRPNSNPMLSNK